MKNVFGVEEVSFRVQLARGWQVVCKGLQRGHVEGLTLVEVLISLMLAATATLAIYSGVTLAMRHSQHTAHRVAAFGRCRQRLEEMRGMPYVQVTTANFPDETVRLTHLGGMRRLPLEATISNTITEAADPARKRVVITAQWQYMGQTMTETVSGYIFDRDSRASSLGVVTGSLTLNPSSELPSEFTVWLPDGEEIGLNDLDTGDVAYSGPASHVRFSPGGSGMQTSLRQNFEPFPLSNAGRWGLSTSESMNITLSRNASDDRWTLAVDGTGVVISSY